MNGDHGRGGADADLDPRHRQSDKVAKILFLSVAATVIACAFVTIYIMHSVDFDNHPP